MSGETSQSKTSQNNMVFVKQTFPYYVVISDATGYWIEVIVGKEIKNNNNVEKELRELIKKHEVAKVSVYRYDRDTGRNILLFSLNSTEAMIYLGDDYGWGDLYMTIGMIFIDSEPPFTEFLLDVLDGKLSVRDYLIKSIEHVKDMVNTEIQASIPDL